MNKNYFKKFYLILYKIFTIFIIFLIKTYQLCISPFFPKRCNFEPSCSNYMIQAIKIHGILKGILLGIKRILKCTPNREFTYDPVPEKKIANKN